MKTVWLRCGAFLLLATALLIHPAKADPNIQSDEPAFRVLLFSHTTGFRHRSIPAGIAAVEKLAQENNFSVDPTEDPARFSGENLSRYDVVLFMNTNGTLFNDDQRVALKQFIQNGGGYVGVHSASATEYDWDWYRQLVGAHFSTHPKIQPATIVVENHNHLSTAHLPKRWERVDEWYNFRSNPREEVNVLLSIDTESMNGSEMNGDHPIAWYREFDGGRTWFTGLGHTDEAYQEPAFLKHLLGGILWAADRETESSFQNENQDS
ncbi:MAG TPA: ThuA domain-containing protein [Opitutales bacterium]|nr:ThuA domain-containing protein [Opitutales bacterium]